MKARLLSILVLSLAAVLGIGWWRSQLAAPLDFSDQKVYFVITTGESSGSVITRLKQAHLIRSELATKVYVYFTHTSRVIRPGGYTLLPTSPVPVLIQELVAGPSDLWVTIPEGWRREQIAARLASVLPGFDTSGFLSATATLEGQLFPDTYLLPPDAPVARILSIFQANFAKKTGLDLRSPQDRQILILASLVEREAASPTDRPTIAGILLKRLAAGWPLQLDATIQYARDTETCKLQIAREAGSGTDPGCKFWEPILDTKLASPYNTYLHPGLPPAPVANPGLDSLQAVQAPQTSPYWYYLHSPDGQTHYAVSLSEHQSNIDKYLRP